MSPRDRSGMTDGVSAELNPEPSSPDPNSKGPDETQHTRQNAVEGAVNAPTGDDLDHDTRANQIKGPAETQEA